MKAKIELNARNHREREKSIELLTIFGSVYAPRSVIRRTGNVVTVPVWVFSNRRLNPCQMVEGYIGIE